MTSQSIDDDQQQKIGAINYEVMVHRIRQPENLAVPQNT